MTPPKPPSGLTIEVDYAGSIPEARWREIVDLCEAAFNENLDGYLRNLSAVTHVLAYREGALVSHTCWVVRWLEPGDLNPLRTAYVEAVATAPEHQRKGYATEVIRRLAIEVKDFGLTGLSTGLPSFYERLGWDQWRGPLAIRAEGGLQPTSLDSAMVLRLPTTPELDVDWPMTAEWREGELW